MSGNVPTHNSDVDVVATILVRNVADGVEIAMIPASGRGMKSLSFITGSYVRRNTTIVINRRVGGTVAVVKGERP